MDFYHAHFELVGRSQGQNAIAAAAYMGGISLQKLDGSMADYRKKQDVRGGKIILPSRLNSASTPSVQWVWEQAEKAEKRKNSCVARKGDLALPLGLSLQEYLSIGRGYAQDIADRYRVIAYLNFHHLAGKNPHIDLMWTTREYDGEKLTIKTRVLDDQASGANEILWLRERWAKRVNEVLHRHGRHVDHRSYKDQGSDKIAQKHLGRRAAALERQGVETDIGIHNRKVRKHNRLVDEKEKLGLEIASLGAQIKEQSYVREEEQRTSGRKIDENFRRRRRAGTGTPAASGSGDHAPQDKSYAHEAAGQHGNPPGRDIAQLFHDLVGVDERGASFESSHHHGRAGVLAGNNEVSGFDRFAETGAGLSQTPGGASGRTCRPSGTGASGGLGIAGQPPGGQGPTQRRDIGSGHASVETTTGTRRQVGSEGSPAAWEILTEPFMNSVGIINRLPAQAAAISRKCRDISGRLTMAAVDQAVWTRQWDFLLPAENKLRFNVSELVSGIKAKVKNIAGLETLMALNNSLFAREWKFLHVPIMEPHLTGWRDSSHAICSRVEAISGSLTLNAVNAALFRRQWEFLQRPFDAYAVDVNLLEQAARIHHSTRMLSGQLTMQTMAAQLQLHEDWRSLCARHHVHIDYDKRTTAKLHAQAANIRRITSAISGDLTLSAMGEIFEQAASQIMQNQGDNHESSCIRFQP